MIIRLSDIKKMPHTLSYTTDYGMDIVEYNAEHEVVCKWKIKTKKIIGRISKIEKFKPRPFIDYLND